MGIIVTEITDAPSHSNYHIIHIKHKFPALWCNYLVWGGAKHITIIIFAFSDNSKLFWEDKTQMYLVATKGKTTGVIMQRFVKFVIFL
jgi:hypothetical protein